MAYFGFVWTDETIEHLAEHGIAPENFEQVLLNPTKQGTSQSSGRPAAWGYTDDGRYIIVIYEMIDDVTILPVTAYEMSQ